VLALCWLAWLGSEAGPRAVVAPAVGYAVSCARRDASLPGRRDEPDDERYGYLGILRRDPVSILTRPDS
jgi:hypothetical protein